MNGANKKLLTAASLLLGLGGCTPGILDDIDRLEGEAWVDVHEDPTDPGFVQYGRDIAFGGASSDAALRLFVLGEFPDAGAAPVDYAEDGKRSFPDAILPENVQEQASESDPPLPLAGDPAGDSPVVGLGYRSEGGEARVHLIDADAAETLGDVALLSGPGFPRALAFGEVDGNEERDLVATLGTGGADARLLVVSGFTPTGQNSAVSCTFSEEITALLVRDLNGDGTDEILVALPSSVEVFAAAAVANNDGSACPAGGTSFASGQVEAMAIGDLDDDGQLDLLAGRPGANQVDLYRDVASSPSTEAIAGSDSPERFGAALAVGDFNQDGVDDLAVGDPAAEADGHPGGGLVHLYTGGGDFPGAPVEPPLRDNTPSDDQAFGRALEVGVFGGASDVLAVGADGEVFTYFRLFSSAEDPRSSP